MVTSPPAFAPIYFFPVWVLSNISHRVGNVKKCDVISNRSFCYSFGTLMFFLQYGSCQIFLAKLAAFAPLCFSPVWVLSNISHRVGNVKKHFFVMFQQQKLLLQLLHPYVFSPVHSFSCIRNG